MNQLLPPEQGSMVRGKAYLSDVQKREVVRKLALARFGPPSTFEPVLDPERSDPKKGALAARSRGKRTLIVQSLH